MVTWLAAHDGLARPAHADASDNAFQGDNSLNAFLNAGARLAHTLSTTGSPVITLGGGLTAGAAAGIFLGGSIRAVAANSLFSVPDVAVGLSPASGTAVWLSRLSGSSSLGLYAALTGAPIGAGDQVISGIATHLLDEHAFLVNTSESIGAELSTLYSRNFERLLLAVELFQTDQVPLPPLLTRYGPLLDEAFAEPTAAAIVQRLRAATDPDVIHWAHRTAQLIETHCPLAVSATLRLLRELQSAPLADAIVLEHRVARRLGERGSVFDALRAIKIDDEPVKWRHASLDAVTTAELDALFAAPAANSAEHRLEAALVEWKLAEHVPKASQTLGPEPFIGLESPRTQLAHLISERLESVESLNSALSEVEGLTEDEEEKRLKFVPATRDDIREREQLMPVDRV
jgi:enoyl-CoA hydratase/carnithine racemase